MQKNTGQKTNYKYKQETILKLNATQKQQTMQNTAKHNYMYLGSVTSYDNPPGNEVGLFYNAPEP